MLSTFTVTNTNDSGAGSLRQAIVSSNADPEIANAIDFDIPGGGVQTIDLLSGLPALTQRVTIDGTTQPGSDGQHPLIQIDGSQAGQGVVGLDVESSASGSSFHGLAITDFSGGGMLVNGASNVDIVNDDIGLVQTGTGVVAQGNGVFGVELENGANYDSLAGDVVSGQTGNGIVITGSGTMTNMVEDTEIGTDLSGMTGVDFAGKSLANTEGGVTITGGASDNMVRQDVISNNGCYGVNISGTGTSGNLVEGSYIGTNNTGTAALPNYDGVIIQSGASGNIIGAPLPGTGGSATQAPATSGGPATQVPATSGGSATQVPGNTTTHVPAVVQPVVPYPTAPDFRGDVISGNDWEGVHIVGSSGNVVDGDYIGVTAGGNASLGNAESGVGIYAGASNNTIGGSVSGSGDVISGNNSNGVYITDGGTTGNVVEGDFIGTDSTGSKALPNSGSGVVIQNAAVDNTIGGTTGTAGDVISSNDWEGVHIVGTGTADNETSGNVVEGDYIGLGISGTERLGNAESGVGIYAGASNNTIGGSVLGSGDVISGNDSNGLYITDSGTNGNVVEGDFIGTDWTGSNPMPNTGSGVVIQNGAADNTIGGTASTSGGALAGAGDVVSGNGWEGVHIVGSSDNVVEGDYIGLNVDGTERLGNAESGVGIYAGATDNTIGGSVSGTSDVISGNDSNGLYITDSGTNGNVVEGDFIGTDWTGSNPMPNTGSGVVIQNGAADNTIGGTTPGDRDVISGNNWEGVHIVGTGTAENETSGNVVEGDYIGSSADGSAALGNKESGVGIYSGANNNTIGGSESGAGDVISGNDSNGVYIVDFGTSGNVVAGDDIGLSADQSQKLANSAIGVYIGDGASGNTIGGLSSISGGSLAGAGNVISGNTGDGVQLVGNGTIDNVVEGNFIGLTATGITGLGNELNGVSVFGGASYNTIGGAASGSGNVISANGGNGVSISDSGTSFNLLAGNLIGTDPTGLNGAGNGEDGVLVQNGATNSRIGGNATGCGNIISDNAGDGVRVTGSGTTAFVQGNEIGLSADGATLDNRGYDVEVDSGATIGAFPNNATPSTGRMSGAPAQ
jgi:hypothetical protein